MATPALGALLWLGGFPSLKVIALGMMTAVAGYTAVYALNDVTDFRVDKEKIQRGKLDDSDISLDSLIVRHPIAQGLLSLREGLMWMMGWALLTLIGAFLLNPVCVLIFLTGCILEIAYCLLFKVTWLRTIVSGAVKTSGGMAAVFAVDPNPSLPFLVILFLWLSLWEIGGQNIPNDLTDMEEDRSLKARTVPVRFGAKGASMIILGAIILVVALGVIIFGYTAVRFETYYVGGFFLAGLYLLLIPAFRLYKSRERSHAMALFDRASYYPLVLLIVVTVKLIF